MNSYQDPFLIVNVFSGWQSIIIYTNLNCIGVLNEK